MLNYFKNLINTYSVKFLIFVIYVKSLLKGVVFYGITINILYLLLVSFDLNSDLIQLYSSIPFLPWTMKPLFGILIDSLKIFEFKKYFWMLQALFIGFVSIIILMISETTLYTTLICFFGLNYYISFIDLIVESKYSEILCSNSQSGSNIITYINIFEKLGTICGILLSLIYVKQQNLYALYILICIIMLLTSIPVIFNFLPNDKNVTEVYDVESQENVRLDKVFIFCMLDVSYIKDKKTLLFILNCVFLCVSSLMLPLIGIKYGNNVVILVSFIVIIELLLIVLISADINTISVIIFISITMVMFPSFDAILNYYYLSYENGPHFSKEFYFIDISIMSCIVSFITSMLYQKFLSNKNYRFVFILGCTLLIMTESLKALSFYDNTFMNEIYYVIVKIIETVGYTIYFTPLFTLISKICKSGMESIMFSFLVGYFSFCEIYQNYLGIFILNLFNISENSNIEYIWILILVFGVAIQIITTSIGILIIPNVKQNEELTQYN